MTRLQQIEHDIEQLTNEEFNELTRWLFERDDERWVEQMDNDAVARRLDFLVEEARNDKEVKDWP